MKRRLPARSLEELIGGVYPEKAKLLGQRTGELHLALASVRDDRAFRARAIQRHGATFGLSNHARACCAAIFALLAEEAAGRAGSLRDEAKEVLGAEKEILAREKRLLDRKQRRARFASTAIIISARCFTPEKISSFSISKANRRGR